MQASVMTEFLVGIKAVAKLDGPHVPGSRKELERSIATGRSELDDAQEAASAASRKDANATVEARGADESIGCDARSAADDYPEELDGASEASSSD
jgi:hypothetical protein